jgi:hypothetical protein
MCTPPKIILDSPGIKVLDLREAQNAIRRKYGPRYHVMDEALREVAALWDIAPGNHRINDCGVFIPYEVISCRTARASAEIRMAESPSGLWAMDISYHAPISGAGAAPSVWNRIAFFSKDDARMAGLHELIGIFTRKAAAGPEAAEAGKMLVMLENARTPQLELF